MTFALAASGVGYFAWLVMSVDDPAARALAVLAAAAQWPFWRGVAWLLWSASSKVSEDDADALRLRYSRRFGAGKAGLVRSTAKEPLAK